MKISARVRNSQGSHHVTLTTDGHARPLSIPPKATGLGSSVNGGELLFLALAPVTAMTSTGKRPSGRSGSRVLRSRFRGSSAQRESLQDR